MSTATQSLPVIVPTDGMVITESAQLKPGVYVLPAGLTIAADDVVLDGRGATLIGQDRAGTGVTIAGRRAVTVRNLRLRDYYHGIAVHDSAHVTLTGNHVTSTAEIPANTIFLNIWEPADKAYGGGILLNRVTDTEVAHNDLQHQMNGLLTYDCRRLTVRGNNANYCSGFGFHLNRTCESTFEDNWADYCSRYEPRDKDADHPHGKVGRGTYGHMGADATGFLIIQASCRNVFRRNFARLGGDGFFLAGRNPQGEDVGCNDNLFEENDGSLSPNIAFEATFSSGNIFRNNWADRCNYGFWLGFSRDNVIEGNRMLYNRQAGIAVENGVGFQVRNNDFQSNGYGVLVWTKYIKAFYDSPRDNRTSRDWHIEGNKFFRNGTAVAVLADKDHGIRPMPPEVSGKPELRPVNHVIVRNDIQDNRIGVHLDNTDGTIVEHNKLSHNVEANIRRDNDEGSRIQFNLGAAGAYL
jgi:parallel beta-helix repeat protein